MSLYADIQSQRAIVERERRKLLQMLTTAVILRDGTACHYCGVPTIIANAGNSRRRTVDHVIPRKFGGDDSIENLVLACGDCNSRKGAQVNHSLLCPRCTGHAREAHTL